MIASLLNSLNDMIYPENVPDCENVTQLLLVPLNKRETDGGVFRNSGFDIQISLHFSFPMFFKMWFEI